MGLSGPGYLLVLGGAASGEPNVLSARTDPATGDLPSFEQQPDLAGALKRPMAP